MVWATPICSVRSWLCLVTESALWMSAIISFLTILLYALILCTPTIIFLLTIPLISWPTSFFLLGIILTSFMSWQVSVTSLWVTFLSNLLVMSSSLFYVFMFMPCGVLYLLLFVLLLFWGLCALIAKLEITVWHQIYVFSLFLCTSSSLIALHLVYVYCSQIFLLQLFMHSWVACEDDGMWSKCSKEQ